jgi:hypothetical protein
MLKAGTDLRISVALFQLRQKQTGAPPDTKSLVKPRAF